MCKHNVQTGLHVFRLCQDVCRHVYIMWTCVYNVCTCLDMSLGWQWCCQGYHCILQVSVIKTSCNITVLLLWCHWKQHWCYVMLMASSVTAASSLCEDNWNMTFCSCDAVSTSSSNFMTLLALSKAPFSSVGWDDWHDFDHVMVVLALHGTINANIAFFRSRWLNKVQHDFFSHFTLLALASALCDANVIVNSTTAFIKSWW